LRFYEFPSYDEWREETRWMLTYGLVFTQSDQAEANGKHAGVDS
jgi:hypothetical protein